MKDKKDNFNQFILISLGLHLVLFIFLTVKVVFFPRELTRHEPAVRVDMVALPEKIKPQVPLAEKAKPKPKPPPKEVEKPKPVPPPKKEPPKPKPKPKVKKPKAKPKPAKPKPKPQSKAMKKEQQGALERIKARKNLEAKQEEETQKREYKGNELSKGDSLGGIQKLQHDSYLGDLNNHIKNHWNLPEWLADKELKATVVLLISDSGRIKSKRFISRSGNTLFDQQVNDTLEKANPLPPPPDDLVSFFANEGVEIRFPD